MKRYTQYFIPAIITVVVLTFMFLAGFFDRWNLRLSDMLFFQRSPHPDIALIAIDDRSIREIGQWPWKRSVYADLLKNLGATPSAIGINATFSEPSSPEEDGALAEQLTKTAPIVLPTEGTGVWYTEEGVILQKLIAPIPTFSSHTKSGLLNMVIDPDTIVRQIPLRIEGRGYESLTGFSLELTNQYLSARQRPPISIDSVPLHNGLLRINYVGKPGTFPLYSFVDVLNKRIDSSQLQGKIVLIGVTALDLHDEAMTPMSQHAMSSIEIQANAIQTLLERKYLEKENIVITIITIAVLSLSIALFFAIFRTALATLFTAIITIIWIAITYVSFERGTLRNLIYPLMTIMYAYFTQILYRYFQETRQRSFIKKAFSYYLSQSVMSEMLSSPQKLSLGGKRQEITVLFSDIVGFTTISERLEPETLSRLLNRYLNYMTDIIFKHKGVLDKYIGDAVMAFWNAPIQDNDHALQACRTALAMQEKIMDHKKDWRDHGIENFSVRIGINTGNMVVGNMGSDVRFEYTLLGDNVNIGARLEGLNKVYGTQILITGSTYKEVRTQVVAREIDTVAVKGKENGITVFELRHLGTPSSEEQKFLTLFENARAYYQEGQFKKALIAFESLKKHYPEDQPVQVYINRCQEYCKNRPKNWDGVYRSEIK